MPATLIFKCESNGFLFDYPVELTEGDEQDIPAFVVGFAEWLTEKGIKPVKGGNPAQQGAQQRYANNGGGNSGGQRSNGYSNGGGNRGGYNGGGNGGYRNNGGGANRYARQDDGWECPEHGSENVGPGYKGSGLECKVFSDYPEEWTKAKPMVTRTGDERYYCRHNSNNRN